MTHSTCSAHSHPPYNLHHHIKSTYTRSKLFFFNDTAPTEIYTLSLHDALPISPCWNRRPGGWCGRRSKWLPARAGRSEEHTSELQSQSNLVCRLLLEKKKMWMVEMWDASWRTVWVDCIVVKWVDYGMDWRCVGS